MRAMSDKMTALICFVGNDYRLEEIVVPKIGTDEVLIKVGAREICVSDVKGYRIAPRL